MKKEFKDHIEYYNDEGQRHRDDDLPAVEYFSGTKYWYQNGKPHRLNGPAAEYINGTKWWYQNGKFHRDNGPAIEWSNGSKEWYFQGKNIMCSTTEEFQQLVKLRAFW